MGTLIISGSTTPASRPNKSASAEREHGARHAVRCGVFSAVDQTDKSAADYYAESLAIVEEADKLGFSHARTVEHYFTRYGGYSPNPIVFLTAMSQRTKTMRLVTGAVLPVFNHPFKLAGEIGMLDGISGGRLDVGFARAFLPHEFRRFGISPDKSQARFREGLEQIELLLTQEMSPIAANSIPSRTSHHCRGRPKGHAQNSTSRPPRRRNRSSSQATKAIR